MYVALPWLICSPSLLMNLLLETIYIKFAKTTQDELKLFCCNALLTTPICTKSAYHMEHMVLRMWQMNMWACLLTRGNIARPPWQVQSRGSSGRCRKKVKRQLFDTYERTSLLVKAKMLFLYLECLSRYRRNIQLQKCILRICFEEFKEWSK